LSATQDYSLKTTIVFPTADPDSLKLLEIVNPAQIDAQLALSQANAKSAMPDTSYTRTNVFLPALLEPTVSMEDALLAQTDVLAAIPINVLFARKELAFGTENACQSAPEEPSWMLLNAKTATSTA
jgi:hypothetical protein